MSLAAKLDAAKIARANGRNRIILGKWRDVTPGTEFFMERVKLIHNFEKPSVNATLRELPHGPTYCMFLPSYYLTAFPEDEVERYNKGEVGKVIFTFKGMDGASADLDHKDAPPNMQ